MTLPPWLIKRTPKSRNIKAIKELLSGLPVETVCENAKCPNIGECYSEKTVTFMILGNICTRSCGFCAVKHGKPKSVDENEPRIIAEATKRLNLSHVVITSVTRDDLPDGGAGQFAKCVYQLSTNNSQLTTEVLIPDFQGDENSLRIVVDAKPDILNHNIETIPRLYKTVRPQANYERSLNVLKNARKMSVNCTKSGLMVGLGEREEEVFQVMKDLKSAGCDVLTIGQYLSPSKENLKVEEYINPSQFEKYKDFGYELGFTHIESGPFVRSSYKAKIWKNH